jgi:hypothetical protein
MIRYSAVTIADPMKWLHLCVAAGLSSLFVVAPALGTEKPAPLEKCGAPPAGVSRLASYVGVEVPARYWVDLSWQDGEWRPADHLPMPHHHATRLELTNVAAFSSLAKYRRGRVRFTIDIASRDIRKVSDRNGWRVTYAARIVEACLPPAAREPA